MMPIIPFIFKRQRDSAHAPRRPIRVARTPKLKIQLGKMELSLVSYPVKATTTIEKTLSSVGASVRI